MERNIFRYILKHSWRDQCMIVLLTLLSFPVLYSTLELPKQIINEGISGKDFPREVLGHSFDQIPYLLLLCFAFLGAVLLNNGFKYVINNMKGRTGERLLRRFRFELVQRVFRFPLPRFRRVSAGEVIPMVTNEVEPMGGFIGESFALPVFQGGTLLVYLGFIFMQDPVLGAAAVSLYPFQAWLIPRLRRRVRELSRQQIVTMRGISDKIGESISAIPEVHANGTASWHLADLADRYGDVYDIRISIFRRKFAIKLLNNFINQLTPFFFFSIGGYLVIRGQVSFGALVAVLAAYKDLAGPWKELLDYYQQVDDVRVKYEQVVDQFDIPGLLPVEDLAPIEHDRRLVGELSFREVSYGEEGGPKLLEGVNCVLPLDRHTAMVGGAGADDFALLAARLVRPTGGRIMLGDEDYARLPMGLTGRRISYVTDTPRFFGGTVLENLTYGLRQFPLTEAAYDEEAAARRRRRAEEARAAGNLDLDIRADWIDYRAAGSDGPQALKLRIHEVLDLVELHEEIFRLGLSYHFDPDLYPEVAAKIVGARKVLRESISPAASKSVVEFFEEDRFNRNASVAENLLFGTPIGPEFAVGNLARNVYMRSVLDEAGLTQAFVETGAQVARTMVEMFADIEPGSAYFANLSLLLPEEIPTYRAIVDSMGDGGPGVLDEGERLSLMALPFRLVPAKHRLGLFGDGRKQQLQERVLEARRIFARRLPPELKGAVEFFHVDRYNRTLSIQDNILLGKAVHGTPGINKKLADLVNSAVERAELHPLIVNVGLKSPVGTGGSRLSAAQRQKLALARAVLKRPDLLVADHALSSLDGEAQRRIMKRVLQEFAGRGILWIVDGPSQAQIFDRVLLLRGGQVTESEPGAVGGPASDMAAE